MIVIEIQVDESLTQSVDPAPLEAAARAALSKQQASSGAVTILIAGDEMLAALNQSYRGIPAPTDVLSFPAGDQPLLPGEPPYLGDIAISLPRASIQAAAAGHSPLEELQLLTVHGVLHLLGHDHAESAEKQVMWAAQAEILHSLGLAITIPD